MEQIDFANTRPRDPQRQRQGWIFVCKVGHLITYARGGQQTAVAATQDRHNKNGLA